MPGWSTQVFDAVLGTLPSSQREMVLGKITEMGRRHEKFPHYRMTGRQEYRLRVGDDREIYQFDENRGANYLITPGRRREIYR